MHPVAYDQDTKQFLGNLLTHDDSVDDRETGTFLIKNEENTIVLWNQWFPDDPYWIPGALYCGHSVPALLGFAKQELLEEGTVKITDLILSGIPTIKKYIRINLKYGKQTIHTFTQSNATKLAVSDSYMLDWQPRRMFQPLTKFSFDQRLPKDLCIEIEMSDKFFSKKDDRVSFI